MEWGLNMLERSSPNKLALSTSDISSEPSGFLIGHECSFNFRRFLVILHNEPFLCLRICILI